VLLPAPAANEKIYLTTAQAAEAFGVSPDAVRRWVRVGYLEPAVRGERGRLLFEYVAVGRAEKMARDAAIATSGTDRRVRRKLAA
jgi:predicted site-specific integrase-resolvase